MSTIQEAVEAWDTATQRRAHLCVRALLEGVMRASAWLVRVSLRARARLDPSGGAHDVRVAR